LYLAKTHIQFWLRLATEHLAGLGTLFIANDRLAAPWPLGRAVVEAAAAIGWLADPSLSVRVRVARAALVELEDRRQTRNAADYGAGIGPGRIHPTPRQTTPTTSLEHDHQCLGPSGLPSVSRKPERFSVSRRRREPPSLSC
jgi:hypothetical protein